MLHRKQIYWASVPVNQFQVLTIEEQKEFEDERALDALKSDAKEKRIMEEVFIHTSEYFSVQ